MNTWNASVPDEFAGLILAAGRGSRMGGPVPKVVLPLAGKPMVCHVVDTLKGAGISLVCVVVSPDGQPVRSALSDSVSYAVQQEPLGSGDAVASAESVLKERSRHLIVACGDSPLFTGDTLKRLMQTHVHLNAVVTLVTAELDNPGGYGRIVRSKDNRISAIVEEKNASSEQKAISEVNGGLYAFQSDWLWSRLKNRPAKTGEFVLTEVVSEAVQQNLNVEAVSCDPLELYGVNTPEQLQQAKRIIATRLH